MNKKNLINIYLHVPGVQLHFQSFPLHRYFYIRLDSHCLIEILWHKICVFVNTNIHVAYRSARHQYSTISLYVFDIDYQEISFPLNHA